MGAESEVVICSYGVTAFAEFEQQLTRYEQENIDDL